MALTRSMKKIQIIPYENKKDAQIERDINMSYAERWVRMWELIEMSLAFSPTKQLKVFDADDKFITLKRIK